jgi:hypothetical protein
MAELLFLTNKQNNGQSVALEQQLPRANNKQKKVRFAVATTMKWSRKKDIFSALFERRRTLYPLALNNYVTTINIFSYAYYQEDSCSSDPRFTGKSNG